MRSNSFVSLLSRSISSASTSTTPTSLLSFVSSNSGSLAGLSSRLYSSSRTAIISPSIASEEVRLNNLWDNKGALKKKKRLGRGPGSGWGKTAGRGTKGQKARNRPGPGIGFEGGQTPLYKRVRKYGFSNASFRTEYAELSLDKLSSFLERGMLRVDEPITMKDLVACGAVRSSKALRAGVKLLGGSKGASFDFPQPITVEVSAITSGARKALEAQGSKCYCVYYNSLGLRALIRQHSFIERPLMPRFSRVPIGHEEKQLHPTEVPSAPRFGLSEENSRPFHPIEKVY